jgi:hypothetical protein
MQTKTRIRHLTHAQSKKIKWRIRRLMHQQLQTNKQTKNDEFEAGCINETRKRTAHHRRGTPWWNGVKFSRHHGRLHRLQAECCGTQVYVYIDILILMLRCKLHNWSRPSTPLVGEELTSHETNYGCLPLPRRHVGNNWRSHMRFASSRFGLTAHHMGVKPCTIIVLIQHVERLPLLIGHPEFLRADRRIQVSGRLRAHRAQQLVVLLEAEPQIPDGIATFLS